jgi:hypothetical protein
MSVRAAAGRRSATVKLEGLMLKLVRELAEIVMRNPGVIIAPFDRELSPAAASKILGISRRSTHGRWAACRHRVRSRSGPGASGTESPLGLQSMRRFRPQPG